MKVLLCGAHWVEKRGGEFVMGNQKINYYLIKHNNYFCRISPVPGPKKKSNKERFDTVFEMLSIICILFRISASLKIFSDKCDLIVCKHV